MSKRTKSFYLFAKTRQNVNSKDAISLLVEGIHDDIQFPKFSEDYDEISSYLEDHTYYVTSMDDFDQLWEDYLANT